LWYYDKKSVAIEWADAAVVKHASGQLLRKKKILFKRAYVGL
jgi:hypothetical protein